MTSMLDPATNQVLPHTHENGYWAMVVKGRCSIGKCQSPTVDRTCCPVLVVFDEAADFAPVQ